MAKRPWYRMQVEEGESPAAADIYILNDIGGWFEQEIAEWWGIEMGTTAKGFIDELKGLPESVKTIRVHINSAGGDVFGAVAIANALRDQRTTKGRAVETVIEGMAASAASVVFMAGSPARIADNGLLMVHDPMTIAVGNAGQLQKAIDALGRIKGSIIATYQWHSEKTPEELGAFMESETWFDAKGAMAAGLADEVVQGLRAAALLDRRAVAHLKVPEPYAERVKALLEPEAAPEPPPPAAAPLDATAVLSECKAAGLDLEFAAELLDPAAALAPGDVGARISAEKARRSTAQARETEVRAICRMQKQEDLADELVASGMTIEAVRNHLVKLTAKLDKAEVDAALNPDHGTGPKPVIDVVAIYAERNRSRAN